MICKKCHREIPDGSNFCNLCGAAQKEKPRSIKKRGNGQGSVYKLPNGHYRAVVTLGYYNKDGARKRKTVSKEFVKRTDALTALISLREVEKRPSDMRLYDLHELYLQSKEYAELSDSQRNKLTYGWNRWEPMALRGIATLTVDDLQTQIDSAAKTYYPAKDMKVIMSHLYRIAIKKEIVDYNKTEYIDLPDTPTPKLDCWKKEEVDAMWADYANHPFTGYVLIMCYAGLRYGELSTIQLDNIHLNEDYMIGGIKSEAGINREIPIASKIKPIVQRFALEGRNKLLEMNEDTFYKTYWEMVERTQIRHLPPQTCRHYYFSAMTAKGVQGGIIAKTGGHSSYSTTVRNYVTIPLADKLAAVNLIE